MSEARSKNFMLSVATVMLGPRDKLHELNPAEHSIGLVKNYNLSGEKGTTDLTAGLMNDEVFSMVTSRSARSTMEVYEYTARNIAYGLGLAGYSIEEATGDAGKLTSVSVNNGDKTHNLAITKGSNPQDIANGDKISIRNPDDDNIIIAKVTDASGYATTGALVVEADIGTMTLPANSEVQRVTVLDIGGTEQQEEFAAKITGKLADGTWITLLCPRVKMASGFQAAFSQDNYGNIPFELKHLKVLAGEPFYADFKKGLGQIVKNATASYEG